MSDVLEFPSPPLPPYEPPKSKLGHDETWLRFCAEWRALRAQQQKNWALRNLDTMFGMRTDRDIPLDTEPLDKMKELEYHIGEMKPRTMLLARQLLRVAITILAHRSEDPNPQSYLGNGLVLDILHNVLDSLEYCKSRHAHWRALAP